MRPALVGVIAPRFVEPNARTCDGMGCWQLPSHRIHSQSKRPGDVLQRLRDVLDRWHKQRSRRKMKAVHVNRSVEPGSLDVRCDELIEDQRSTITARFDEIVRRPLVSPY